MKLKNIFLLSFLTLTMACTTNRANLPLEKALLGQWKSDKEIFYIGPGRIYRQDITSGERSPMTYKVTSVNITERTVRIEETSASEVYRVLRFSPDRGGFNQVREVMGRQTESAFFVYIDDKQEP